MKQVIFSIRQRVLQGKDKISSILTSNENQQLSLMNNTSFSDLLSTPSQQMRMCACSMSC